MRNEKTYVFLVKRFKRYKVSLFVIFATIIAIPYLTGKVSVIIGEIVDNALVQGQERVLLYLALALLACSVLKESIQFLREHILSRIMIAFASELRKDMFSSLMKGRYGDTKKLSRGELIQRFIDDTEAIKKFGVDAVIKFLSDFIMACTAFYIISTVSWYIAVAGFFVYALYLVPTVYFGKIQRKLTANLRENLGLTNQMFIERFESIRTIKLFGKENKEKEAMKTVLDKWVHLALKRSVMSQTFKFFPRVLDSLAPAIVLVIGGIQYFQGNITIGEIVMVSTLLPAINAPIKQVSATILQLKDIESRVKAVQEVVAIVPEQKSDTPCKKVERLKGSFVLENVCLSNERGIILDNISFQIKAGEKVAFVGESGSGKSTLLKIMAGVQNADSGSVWVDGNNLNELDFKTYRHRLGCIIQTPFIFNDSVEANIEFGTKKYDDKRIKPCLEAVNLYEEVEKYLENDQLLLGENGRVLSGGQRQRLSIARVLIHDFDVLMFDEGTSALDRKTESSVMEFVKNATKDKTCIYVAHRLDAITNVDCIYVFNDGQIAESGSHGQLLEQNGYYRELWDKRLLGGEEGVENDETTG